MDPYGRPDCRPRTPLSGAFRFFRNVRSGRSGRSGRLRPALATPSVFFLVFLGFFLVFSWFFWFFLFSVYFRFLTLSSFVPAPRNESWKCSKVERILTGPRPFRPSAHGFLVSWRASHPRIPLPASGRPWRRLMVILRKSGSLP